MTVYKFNVTKYLFYSSESFFHIQLFTISSILKLHHGHVLNDIDIYHVSQLTIIPLSALLLFWIPRPDVWQELFNDMSWFNGRIFPPGDTWENLEDLKASYNLEEKVDFDGEVLLCTPLRLIKRFLLMQAQVTWIQTLGTNMW